MARSHERLQWALPLLAIAGSGLAGFLFSSHTSQRLDSLERVDSPTLLLSQSLSFSLNATHDGFTYAAAAADKAAVTQALDKAKQFREQAQALGAIGPYAGQAQALKQSFETYVGAAQQVTQALLDAADGKASDPAAASQAMQTAHADLTRRLTQLRQQAEQSLAGGIGAAQDTVHMGLVAGLVGSLAVLAVSLWVGRIAVRSVLRDVGGKPPYAKSIVQRIAGGDLTTPIELHAKDRSSLLYAMQGMQARLAALIGDVRSCASSIDTSSSEIAGGNADLSARTQRQTQQLRETAGSVDELTASVRLNSEHAQQANSLALNASTEAEQGRQAMAQVVAKMNGILQSSQRISEITTMIDGIAFQTNLLALNAAVEAARAGEQGRGFGVVAAEVGSLAQRASSAAREIKDLIRTSTEQIDEGAQQAEETGEAIGRLVDSVKRVGDLIADISAASVQQRAGIEQVNRVVSDLDEATQRNAVLAAQADEASSSLQSVSSRLAQTVSEFTTG